MTECEVSTDAPLTDEALQEIASLELDVEGIQTAAADILRRCQDYDVNRDRAGMMELLRKLAADAESLTGEAKRLISDHCQG